MTNEPNHVTAEVDQAQPKKTKDGVRFLVTLGFPFKANKAMAMMLMEQIGNPLDVDFTLIQASLESVAAAASKTITGPQPTTEYVEVRTFVDGAPAMVMLPVFDGSRRKSIKPHPYKDDPENKGKCLHCKHGEAYQSHNADAIEAAAQVELLKVKSHSNGNRANPVALAEQGAEREAALQAAYATPHAFVPREHDNQCDACGHDADDAVHVEIPEHLRADADEALPDAAAALIAEAQATEAVPS